MLLVAAAMAGPPALGAANISVRAKLDRAQETPAQRAKVLHATGLLTGTLTQTKKGYELAWRLTYKKTSGKATFANVQNGTAKKHGTVIIFLCGPCESGAHGTVYASPGEVSLLLRGRLFVNLTTKRNPSGEIRGQLVQSR
jgi:CHRD domain